MNSTIYKYPINYQYGRQSFSVNASNVRTGAAVISDNKYDDNSTEDRFIIETFGRNRMTDTMITHIFIKGIDIDDYSVSVPTGQGTGTGLASQTIPDAGTVNGIQHDLRAVGPLSAREVQIDISGTNHKLIEVMLLEEVTSISNKFTAINPSRVDRGAELVSNAEGNTLRVASEFRAKWSVNYQAYFDNDASPTADEVIRAFEGEPNEPYRGNLTIAMDFTRFPDRVFPCVVAGGISISYVGGIYTQQQLDWTMLES